MFYAEDEDVTNKVPAVSPNDVIDIEISPIIRAQGSSWLKGFDKTQSTHKAQTLIPTTKEKKTKKLKHSHLTLKKQRDIMKRGDPFLPSVTCDENPVEDFSAKKGTHKKQLDCKCKGMGFNSSPSAVLPEEMRQQWGYGMFGKTTPTRASCADTSEIVNSARSAVSNGHSFENLVSKTFSDKFLCGGNTTEPRNSPGFVTGGLTPVHCCECKKASCCCPSPKLKQESFSYSEATERKRPKLTTKNSGYKIKGSKTQILISGKHSLQTMKTIACINSKENTNIISTSNFNKYNHSSSSFSSFRHELDSGSPNFKGGISIGNSGRHSTVQGNAIDCAYTTRNKMYASPPPMVSDEADATPCSRYRHRIKATRRSFVNMRQPLSLATRENPVNGTVRFYETRKCLPRVTPQTYTPGSHMCSCDRCRRKALLLSKMEALGFPSSSAHMNPSPHPYPIPQRYFAPGGPQSSFHSSNRYPSCTPVSHTYVSNPGLYCPPNSYDRSSPTTFEHDPYSNKADILSNSPMPFMSRGVNTDATSYLDTEPSLESPLSYSGIIEDITDLSIKDTVEFFMTLRSPLADSQKSTLSDDTSSDMLPGLSSEDEAFNCCIGSCACSIKDTHHPFTQSNSSEVMSMDKLTSSPPNQLKVHNYTDSCPSDAPTQSMSLLYSSLMSNLGLEDELRCAIENIPME